MLSFVLFLECIAAVQLLSLLAATLVPHVVPASYGVC